MPSSRLNYSPGWLVCFLVSFCVSQTHSKDVLTVPEQVSLSTNMDTQQLSISWVGGGAASFDVMILRTELNETVFYETVSASVDLATGRHMWNWTSVEPLECTSLSVQVCSRDGEKTSEWSSTQILQGMDLPSNDKFQMFPQDRVVPVGTNTTFCCIVEEGREFASLRYGNMFMNATRVSRRSYASTAVSQRASGGTGTNVVCLSLQSRMTGAVVFVGYPPQPQEFECETRDLVSAVCQWNVGRDTHLYGRRKTKFSLNKRDCPPIPRNEVRLRVCSLDHWEENWTLEAVNSLGKSVLTDSAEIRSRLYPVAPVSMTSVNNAWNATVSWQWENSNYSSVALVCQVQLNQSMQTIVGVGLRSAFLPNLYPDQTYAVQVRCGSHEKFWKWGTWSQTYTFKTQPYAPEAPDVWQQMNSDGTGTILWKRATAKQSHGRITAYQVTIWSPELEAQHFEIPSTNTSLHVTHFGNSSKVMATVVAKNIAGESPPAAVVLPLQVEDRKLVSVSKAVYFDGGFPLLWLSSSNSSCGYVVEWRDALCQLHCPLEWMKVTSGTTNVSVVSANFQPGVRYDMSLYGCSSEELQRWQGFSQELAPSGPVAELSPAQQDSDVLLTWGEVPPVNRRGFLLGYNIYINDGPQQELIANIPDPDIRNYTVKGLSLGSYKFTVKAYTAAGEDSGATVSILLEPYTDWLILEILASLGTTALFLAFVTLICYKKRKWVKRAFYPDIPEPKLPGDWSSAQQRPLDVKPSSHSLVHVVEKPEWDSSKEVLVVIPEEDEEDEVLDDTDEPTSLRYYNQVPDERPIRPRYPDSSESSASSLDSASTDVTYTGIQTTGSSLVFPEGSTDGPPPGSGDDACGGYRPQMRPQLQGDGSGQAPDAPFLELEDGCPSGYKPQIHWNMDSPGEAAAGGEAAPCLGSPTSIASTQFLLHDGESTEHDDEKRHQTTSAASWFNNLLSSAKP